MPGIQTILHPTDFSENALPAFETACALARDYDATLLVLHVMGAAVSPFLSGMPPDPLRPAEAQGAGDRFPWPRPSDPRVRVDYRLAEGDAPEEILRISQALRADLIVMGTHGKTGLGRLLTGSVAEEVLRRSACPVMVVKIPLGPTAGAHSAEIPANPGDVIDVRPLGSALAAARTRILVSTPRTEVVRLIINTGEKVASRKNRGEATFHILEGRVALTALGKSQTLGAGMLLMLPADEAYSLTGIEESSLLLVTTPRGD
jgi:nucleotide-binding universal stress UspA family protein/quercetin dioxygenase-like cupin family protein